jgi:hypothetical protein
MGKRRKPSDKCEVPQHCTNHESEGLPRTLATPGRDTSARSRQDDWPVWTRAPLGRLGSRPAQAPGL